MQETIDKAVFSPDEERTLASVLDTIVPPDPGRGMPGAGSLGLASAFTAVVRGAAELGPVVAAGLAAADEAARGRGAPGFTALPPGERAATLEEAEAARPGFVPMILFHVYRLYYEQPAVLEALGLPPRPPYPKGYETPPDDLGLLDHVRARKKLWRDA